MAAYYNEIDPYVAQWLRNLIVDGHIAPGEVDERDIRDVHPDDIRAFTQCHFFAGIGVWSHALRRAGWPDDRPVWTGSCPCQPFSAAGAGLGFADERHLWPHWHHLISECRPAVVFGEQVASKDADAWIDLVCADLEAMDYALGAIPFPSAGVGAPHIRDRLYWVAHADHARPQGRGRVRQRSTERAAGPGCLAGGLANSYEHGRETTGKTGRERAEQDAESCGADCRVAAADCGTGRQGSAIDRRRNTRGNAVARAGFSRDGMPYGVGRIEPAGPVNGFWRAADWLLCRDEKWRPVESGTSPLAHGAPARVGRLRAYGNAINAEAATAFIECAIEVMP